MHHTKERKRLAERIDNKGWKKWGPYLSERQWGTVREDYSAHGDAWNYFSHDLARSRAYRWGEDGIGGISDNKQFVCFACAFWNHEDKIIKERLFGLTNIQGNHGEDVKEVYYYLDSTPTHSYMKMLYKYPTKEFPYDEFIEHNETRNTTHSEYEMHQTEMFKNNEYFDIYIEYAKGDINDICIKITATNKSEAPAPLVFLPTLWFRNYWSWGYKDLKAKPNLHAVTDQTISLQHMYFDRLHLYCDGADELIFCENETNIKKVFNQDSENGYPKDGINDYITLKDDTCINPKKSGTKASAVFRKNLQPQETVVVRLRFTDLIYLNSPFKEFEEIFKLRIAEADEFYATIQRKIQSQEEKNIQRQALAGMMWNKQFYYFNVEQWSEGDPIMPHNFESRHWVRNKAWKHAYMANILSMPDKWEYPWFAAWDLAFHTVTIAMVDPDFAKRQLAVVLREYYMHPNGQMPAYEWNFSDVNPPVHAWAALKVYEIEKEQNGGVGDLRFLERIFHKLLLNFTWWVNQKDEDGNNIFGGGFLGLDNIGVFDRNDQRPGIKLKQADATGWMAIYTLNMLKIACEISLERYAYQDMASKFFEHFLYIAAAINKPLDEKGMGLWDEEDQFYYDKIHTPESNTVFLKLRSLVGLIPLCAVVVIDDQLLAKLPDFKRRLEWILKNRPDLASLISRWHEEGKGNSHLLSLLRGHRMRMVFSRLFDQNEFLSDYGIRSLSKHYLDHPYNFNLQGQRLTVTYTPGESDLTMMGGNSNWRGPIWFPINYLIIDSLHQYSYYYGDAYEVEYPAGSGHIVTIREAAYRISQKLIDIFRKNDDDEKPYNAESRIFDKHPDMKDYYHFYEYFHGDSGQGLGASHQTGWTGLVANLIAETAEYKAKFLNEE
ncbi:MAG: glucosidase [Saprospiraceae bacterium]|nr:glucosidase [Saprospiraceae bacterium]